MDVKTAITAIKAILCACDDKTKAIVLKSISTQETPFQPRQSMRSLSLMDAREDLIKNHFKY